MTRLIALGRAGAVVGGSLRIVAAFVPYDPKLVWLEGLYAAIDIGLLFGLIALYLVHADRIGRSGLALFALALVAMASIIGPDAKSFGVDWYMAGASVFLAALAGLSAVLLWKGVERGPAIFWLVAFGLGCLLMIGGHPMLLTASGVSLGIGFLLFGITNKTS